MMSRCLLCVCLLSGVAFAQTPTAFEVASIRSSGDQVQQVQTRVRVAGSQVRLITLSLKDVIGMAYGVKPQQIDGPDWIGRDHFDIAATIPAGATVVQLPDMLRTLLADRFKMTMHRETREFPVYILGAAKSGVKLQPAKPAEQPPDTATEKPPAVNVTAGGSANGVGVDLGSGSSMTIGNNKLAVTRMTMFQFAEVLTRFVDRPVLDQTGVNGFYDITLDIAPEDYMTLLIRSGVNAGVSLPPQALRLLDNANPDPLSAPLQAVGLTLESRKSPLQVIVVDAVLKTPTEN